MKIGVKLNDPQTGHHTLNLPVSLEQVQKIEVVTGGSREFLEISHIMVQLI